MAVTDVYISGAMSRLYANLEHFVRQELNDEVDAEFRRHNPGRPMTPLDWQIHQDRPAAREWLRIRDRLLEEKKKGFVFHRLPPAVYQGWAPRCWASAMESWLYVTAMPYPPLTRITAEQLIERFSAEYGGALNTAKLNEVLGHFGSTSELVRANRMTYRHMLERLRTKGPLLLFFGTGALMGHTVVGWGVSIHDSGRSVLKAMDPFYGKNVDASFKDLRERNVYVAWKATVKLSSERLLPRPATQVRANN